MFSQKLPLFGELRRFRRQHDLRAESSVLTALKSCKKDETEPSYEVLSGKNGTGALVRGVSISWGNSFATGARGYPPSRFSP